MSKVAKKKAKKALPKARSARKAAPKKKAAPARAVKAPAAKAGNFLPFPITHLVAWPKCWLLPSERNTVA